MYNRDPIVLNRDCEAVLVPMADKVIIPKDTEVMIAQDLGGSYTVYVNGSLARIAGKDADALGLEPVEPPTLPEEASDEELEKLAWDQMRTCFDPEIPINIVDLGLVYECTISSLPDGQKQLDIKMTLTAPGCGMGGILVQDVKEKVEAIPAVEVANVELVFDPPWNQNMMSDAAKIQTGMY
ncbi:putative Fe-S cluster assembly protein SufT [Nitrosococcus wardiae]|uniref:Putative Fe-S cluster assembly protein SufT n=1 Tax=Nitrosococcus wardiae TaxID=1814290 RepID=A0A4P7C3L5_9GAMM|nr:putative Fe-S cluster assembly protein SufT [Nitrosococcus wardiae]QBQ56399.1 putative Fe-S cluster assembly protein SufT [Nitrosococcus wardiae]